MKSQDSIRSSKVSRIAALAGTGAKVGMNYLKHYGKKAITGKADREELNRNNAKDIYQTFSHLKGGPLKVAQMLSIDQNMLPAAYAKEFSQAQYSAPPLSYPLVVRTFRREFGKEPLGIFDCFGADAVSGASIGQVHKAGLGKKEFAVKVQYPGVADSLKSDLAVVKPLALQIMGLKEADVIDYFNEVETRLLEETNYDLELKRSVDLSRRSALVKNVCFPEYYPEFSSKRILCMDWVDGITIDKFADGDPSQNERDLIGQALWDFYDHQVNVLREFHADPHPGNFLVHKNKLWVLDFGCTKSLDDDFYQKHFIFLDPGILDDPALFQEAMRNMNIILPTDTREEKQRLMDICERSIRMLARPFHEGEFDFGDPSYLKEIYQMAEENERIGGGFRSLKGKRGSAHSLYVNRTYFGLYSLLARLKAKVKTSHRGRLYKEAV
ncbi:MAG: AarF/UbiB family protein [Verrucomicrobiota bacterium]|nr:AarF/UbiB family protein [Verrucomicrobiota bacterium]